MTRLLSVSAALALLATGCLKPSLTIPRAELERIAEAPKAARSGMLRQVRVVQDTTFASAPTGIDPCLEHDHPTGHLLHINGHGYTGHIGHFDRRYGHHHPGHPGYHRPGPHGIDRAGPTSPRHGGPANGGGHVNSGGGGGSLDFDIADGEAAIVLAVVAAAAFTVVLIATEGLRYDGWVELEPHHPVHLMDGNRQRVVHLADLRLDHLGPDTRAVIRPNDGAGIGAAYLGRAPLDRKGIVWRMEMGGTEVLTPDGVDPVNFAATMQLGYFPLQTFGLLATTTLGTGSYGDNDMIGARYGLEAQFLPLALGRLHLGTYGMAGWTYGARDNGHLRAGESNRVTVGGGAMAEIDLTTRLALSIRAGAHWRDYAVGGFDRPTLSASLGFAVY